jgi:hypothetical protein
MLAEPYAAFFNCFSKEDQWKEEDVQTSGLLFIGTIARQVVSGDWAKKQKLKPREDLKPSDLMIRTFPGSRQVKVWAETPDEVEFLMIHARPGGMLVKRADKPNNRQEQIVIESIPLDDNETIDGNELNGVGLALDTRERLYACFLAGKNVDPYKDLIFDRPVKEECRPFVEMLSRRKTPQDFGYEN